MKIRELQFRHDQDSRICCVALIRDSIQCGILDDAGQ